RLPAQTEAARSSPGVAVPDDIADGDTAPRSAERTAGGDEHLGLSHDPYEYSATEYSIHGAAVPRQEWADLHKAKLASCPQQHWKAGLDGTVGVKFKVYEDKNHVFRKCEEMASPGDYEIVGGHVDDDVVEDIAEWIRDLCRAIAERGEGEGVKTAEAVTEIEIVNIVETASKS
ncbi:hypothetical protein V502_02407, partial [Pseudogymnoascus sp. VKM F-4520 (FW-2644)]